MQARPRSGRAWQPIYYRCYSACAVVHEIGVVSVSYEMTRLLPFRDDPARKNIGRGIAMEGSNQCLVTDAARKLALRAVMHNMANNLSPARDISVN